MYEQFVTCVVESQMLTEIGDSLNWASVCGGNATQRRGILSDDFGEDAQRRSQPWHDQMRFTLSWQSIYPREIISRQLVCWSVCLVHTVCYTLCHALCMILLLSQTIITHYDITGRVAPNYSFHTETISRGILSCRRAMPSWSAHQKTFKCN